MTDRLHRSHGTGVVDRAAFDVSPSVTAPVALWGIRSLPSRESGLVAMTPS